MSKDTATRLSEKDLRRLAKDVRSSTTPHSVKGMSSEFRTVTRDNSGRFVLRKLLGRLAPAH